jgi:uncharacterized protein
VAAFPEGAGFEALDWRVSIAEIAAPGPFSAFPGLDRRLAVLDGRLSLAVGREPPQELSPSSPALHFAGHVLVHAHPIAGTVTDLNVMTRRGRFSSTLAVLDVREAFAPRAGAPTTLILALGALTVRCGAAVWELGRLDALRCEGDASLSIAPHSDSARAYLIGLRALQA